MNRLDPGPAVPSCPPAAPEDKVAGDYPRAIADDYPGWEVRHAGGQWTAWCPAVTLHAPTPTELRAAIEHAITGDPPP